MKASEEESWKHSSYVLYDRETGTVVHLHREAHPASAAAPPEAEILGRLKPHLPAGSDVGALRTDASIAPVRGTRLFVDVQVGTLMRVRAEFAGTAGAKRTRRPAKAAKRGKGS